MNIFYGAIFLLVYYSTIYLIKGDWRKHELLPELPRTNTSVILGKYKNGLVYHNFNKYAHMIIAGTTGYGKTNFIKCLISQLNGEIILIDLKGGFDYSKVSASNISEARTVLADVVGNMRKIRKNHIYVIVDEAGELLPPQHFTRKESAEYLECLTYVSEIARLGRGFKTHLIYATQYPTANILNGQIKQNAETRVCFRLPTDIASRVALDETGAEELPSGHSGLGIYKRDVKFEMQTYEFTERSGWDAKIRVKENKRRENHFIIE